MNFFVFFFFNDLQLSSFCQFHHQGVPDVFQHSTVVELHHGRFPFIVPWTVVRHTKNLQSLQNKPIKKFSKRFSEIFFLKFFPKIFLRNFLKFKKKIFSEMFFWNFFLKKIDCQIFDFWQTCWISIRLITIFVSGLVIKRAMNVKTADTWLGSKSSPWTTTCCSRSTSCCWNSSLTRLLSKKKLSWINFKSTV